jgi:hypothetical protein
MSFFFSPKFPFPQVRDLGGITDAARRLIAGMDRRSAQEKVIIVVVFVLLIGGFIGLAYYAKKK